MVKVRCFRPRLIAALVLMGLAAAMASAKTIGSDRLPLKQGWNLQSSRKVVEGGDVISTSNYNSKDWYAATVPSTVLAAQVAAGDFKEDLFQGMNLRHVPGMSYPVGLNSFSNVPMAKASPYACSWWYRTEFKVPKQLGGKTLWLHFNGINYRANIWLNGRKLADSSEVQGAYRIYEFDVTSFLQPGGSNVLALETFAPTEKELGINWVDWNPAPPDKNLGIWGDVYLTASGSVSVRHPQVTTHFADTTLKEADLTVRADVRNVSDKAVKGMLEALVDGVRIQQPAELGPKETRTIEFTPESFAALKIKNPKVWWPVEMGQPNLHPLSVRFRVGNEISDEQNIRFGIREVVSEFNEQGYRLFKVNGKKILIRGAGWAQDMLMRQDRKNLEAQIQYVLDMRLNTIRLEAMLEVDRFFDLCDEKGLLVMAGWCCCDIWERWQQWTPGVTQNVAIEQLRTQILRMRSHPCMIAWVNGSDGPPPEEVEQAYVNTLKDCRWPNSIINSAADAQSKVTGPSGVKMSGPYDYEPPSYWLTDNRKPGMKEELGSCVYGGAYGFNTETGPGASIPPLESLKKMLPKDHLWPVDDVWAYHSAGERFMTMERWHEAMDNTYGKPDTLDDYLRKAQAMAYDGHRAMYEAYARNKYESTGVVLWMLNNAWPSTFWHLYDYYLYPAGAYFGAKKACEPLHIQYSYDDRSVVVVSTRREAVAGLSASAKIYDLHLKELFSKDVKVDLTADCALRVMNLPALTEGAAPYFVSLSLRDSAGKAISSNFYWLPSKLSTMDWDRTDGTAVTPIATFEDLKGLNSLPSVTLKAAARIVDGESVRVTVSNPSKDLAFQVHVGVRKPGAEEEILPVLWEDNYVSLLPGESRTLTAKYLSKGQLAKGATLVVDGWNVKPVQVTASASN